MLVQGGGEKRKWFWCCGDIGDGGYCDDSEYDDSVVVVLTLMKMVTVIIVFAVIAVLVILVIEVQK